MKKEQGFTLIEMMIVVVLLAVTVGMTSDILISLVRSNTKTQVLNEIEQQANFVSLKLEKELRDAVDAQCPDGQTLRFTRRGNADPVTYHLENGTGVPAYLERLVGEEVGSNVYVKVTSNESPGGVSVSCLEGSPCFEIVSNDPQVVRINLKFEQAQGEGVGSTYSGSAKIESSIVIRSTY